MEGLNCLRVLIGPIRKPDPHAQPTLVLEAQADRLEALRLQLGPQSNHPMLVMRQAVLAASSETDITWFRFNDARLNGVVPLERLQPHYPNLQLVGQDTLPAHTLADVLNAWPATSEGQNCIELSIGQGDPLQMLGGAGAWLHRLQRIQLIGPRANELWREGCDSWLQHQGFRPDPHNPLSWSLDADAVRLIQQQAEIDALRQRLEQEQQQHSEREDRLQAALRHVFPYSTYRDKRPELDAFNDQDLVEHFVNNGIDKDMNLQFSEVASELQQLRVDQAANAARFELLRKKTRDTAQQLDLLKDLLARVMMNPCAPG